MFGLRAGSLEKWTFYIILHSLLSCSSYFLMVKWLAVDAHRQMVATKLGEVIQAEE
jgi:hypothetical protein